LGGGWCWAARPLFQIESDGVPTTRKKNDQNILRSSKVINLCQQNRNSEGNALILEYTQGCVDDHDTFRFLI